MNKGRLEAFSDGVFSIVMTLLVFDIKIPDLPAGSTISDPELWSALSVVVPHVVVFFVTFAVLSVIWINHHFLFHSFAKAVDRKLNLLNLCYLSLVAFVPFSASLLARYPQHQSAALVYGINILLIVFLAGSMITYIRNHREALLHEEITSRLMHQGVFRTRLSLVSYLLGLACTFFYIPASLFFFAFPIVFNAIPGTLDLAERIFSLDLE